MTTAKTYRLKHPVVIGTETISELTFGRVKGKYMRSLPVDPKSYTMDTMMQLASKVTGQSALVFDDMDSEDVVEVLGIVGELFGVGPTTGETQ